MDRLKERSCSTGKLPLTRRRLLEVATAVAGSGPLAVFYHRMGYALAAGKPKVGFVVFNLVGQFWADLIKGMKEATTKAGVDLEILDPQSRPETQVTLLENLIVQKVNAIITIAIDPQGLGPTIQKAHDAKIPVIGVDAIIDNPLVTTNVGTPNREASKQLGEYAVKWLKENRQGKANLGILFATTPIQIERKDGFKDAIQALPTVKIVQEVSAQNTLEAAQAGVENLIAGNPTMDAIFVSSENGVRVALTTLEQRGKLSSMPIFGWDVTVPFLDALKAGNPIALVEQQPYEEGRLALEAAVKAIKGVQVPKSIAVPSIIVTKENVDSVRQKLKQIQGQAYAKSHRGVS
jgi:ribose transport system substrate-binding protein